MTGSTSTPQRRPRNGRGQGHRLGQDIVDAAFQIIEETGDETRVTLSEVARRVGIAVPSIYGHFSGVAPICRAVVERCWQVYDRCVIASIDPATPVMEQLSQFAHNYVAFARTQWGVFRVLLTRDKASAIPSVGDAALASFSRLVAGIAEVLGVPVDSRAARDAALGLWLDVHAVAVLPPAHPRFPWPADSYLVELALSRCCSHAAPAAEPTRSQP